MPSDAVNTQATTKSPIFAAVGISLAIGLGAVLGTTDIGDRRGCDQRPMADAPVHRDAAGSHGRDRGAGE